MDIEQKLIDDTLDILRSISYVAVAKSQKNDLMDKRDLEQDRVRVVGR